MNHPFLRRADSILLFIRTSCLDSSLLAKGRFQPVVNPRFIPSCEGQTEKNAPFVNMRTIHPFLRRADTLYHTLFFGDHDSSPPAKGRPHPDNVCLRPVRFIPSCEGQASVGWMHTDVMVIHPFLRRADETTPEDDYYNNDSSLLTKGRH